MSESTFVTSLPTETQVETGAPVKAGFWMTERDYARLKKRVAEIEPDLQWPTNVAFFLVALFCSTVLFLIPWTATFPTLALSLRLDWGWVAGFAMMILLACLAGICLCAYASWRSRGRRSRDKSSVLEDMEAAEPMGRSAGRGRPSRPRFW